MTANSEMLIEWLPIVGYEGLYEVSSMGEVRSVDRIVPHGMGHSATRRVRGRKLKSHPQKSGHLALALCKDGVPVTQRVHVLVATAFLGPRPEGFECRHLDGNCRNNSVGNLAWGTSSQNKKDAYAHGARPVGERSHLAKYPDKLVQKILVEKGCRTIRETSEQFGVSYHYVKSLWNGRGRAA